MSFFLSETFDATDLNKELKNIMDGLSVKVRERGRACVCVSLCGSVWAGRY